MALAILPDIVVDPITGKTFRQSRAKPLHGMRRYRRAKRLLPGIWYTYANTFADYPSEYRPVADPEAMSASISERNRVGLLRTIGCVKHSESDG